MPDNVVVELTQTGVSCRRPNGTVESVEWTDLKAVIIETTSAGPFFTDVFLILVGDHSGCVVPMGAAGEDALLERLQTLPGFDNKAVIAAMASADDQRFLCWERK